MVVGIVTTRVALMLTATGDVRRGRLGRRCRPYCGQGGRPDEREARRDGTNTWNPHVNSPQCCTFGPGRSERSVLQHPAPVPPSANRRRAASPHSPTWARPLHPPPGRWSADLLAAVAPVADFGRGDDGGREAGMVVAMAVLLGTAVALPPRWTPSSRGGLETPARAPGGDDRDRGRRSGRPVTPRTVSLERGGVLTVENDDNVAHSVTSEAVGTQGDPLFDLVVPAHATRTLCFPRPWCRGVRVLLRLPPQHAGHPDGDGRAGGDVPSRLRSSRPCVSRTS